MARWGQDFSFNFYLPAKSNCDDCDRIAAGCGPVAIGMLLRYHEFPVMNMSFNGQTAFTDCANMPRFAGGCSNNTVGFRSSAMLIRIAGNVMSSDYGGVFGCETATYPANIGDGLDFFGYSHDGKGKLSDRFFDVQNDLENQIPVIFSGATSPVGNNWHIWLADGFQQTSYEQCHNNVCSYYSYSSWSMNWGQHGDGNGWYSTSPNSIDEYDELLRVYTNIRPI
ncbi:C10 family peptidase [Marinoscillum sp.]|uniref:C10 family peptidase n=1 Tax=Marinoscillum sp. TaxID=2024838 RepID=UPI003BA9D039